MKRPGFGLFTMLAVVAGFFLPPTASSAEGDVCAVAPSGGCAVRPHSFGYGAHASVFGIRWQDWGGQRAVGYGRMLWRATVSEPSFGPFAAKVILSEPAECGTHIWYSRRTIKIGRRHGRTLERNHAYGPCYFE